MKTKSNITEKKLTKAELEAREKVIKDLKKNKSALVKRYGKDAEAVMYGRATNIAKKMAESENKNRIKELVRKSLMQEMDIEVGADRYEAEQDLSQASAMMDELESLLKGFDWYYYMSDDPRVYRQWGAVDSKISDLVRKLKDMGYGEDAKSLYNQYAPDGDISMKMKEGKKEDVDGDGDIDSKDYLAKRDAAIKKAKGELKEYKAPEDLVRFLQKQGVKIDLKEPYTYKDIKDALKALGLEGKFDDLMPQNFTITMPEVPKGMFEDNHIKKAKGALKEDWGSSDQYAMNQSIHKDLGEPKEFPGLGKVIDAAESAVDFYWDEWPEYKTDRNGLIMKAARMYSDSMFPEFMDNMRKMFSENLNEDVDLGHEDNEPHMIKGELYQIGKYAMDLYAIMEELEETGGEYDLPGWWQSKITTAKNMISSAKHYLDFELKEPQIDAAVDALTGEEPHMGEPEPPMMEGEISAEEKLAGKIAKALKNKDNKDASDQSNLKQARTALNKGNLEAAKKIAKPYIAEKLAKQLKSK